MTLKTENLETNLGCPTIVVATKCDMFRKHYIAESEADDHFEILLSYLRWWSLKYGTSTFTMAKGMKDQARRILQYVDHRMFDSSFNRGPNAVVKLSNLQDQFLFIPSGFDTKNTITSQFPDRSMEDPIGQHFQKKAKDKKESSEKIHLRSQEDDIFLKTLAFELDRADSGQKGGDSSRAAQRATGATGASGAAANGNGNNAVVCFFLSFFWFFFFVSHWNIIVILFYYTTNIGATIFQIIDYNRFCPNNWPILDIFCFCMFKKLVFFCHLNL